MIVIRNNKDRVQCDGCGNTPANLDNFDSFLISYPIGGYIITQEGRVKFVWNHSLNAPMILHSCPECAKAIRRSLSVNKLNKLPVGPLKKILLASVARSDIKFRAFQIHFLKDSVLGQA